MQAGEYDTAVSLAFLFNWDYWQVQSLPNSYIEEVFARLLAENDLKEKEQDAARESETIARLRANNQATLKKLGLSA